MIDKKPYFIFLDYGKIDKLFNLLQTVLIDMAAVVISW